MSIKKSEAKILKKDYELYKIHLPWNVILKGKTKRFISSELEKKHPCFSDEWIYERKSKLGKKGLDSDVVVMNKFTLAEYRDRYPKKKLLLEGTNRKTSFALNKTIQKFFLTLGGIGLILGYFFLVDALTKNHDLNIIPEAEKTVGNNEIKRNDTVKKFLNTLEKNNGRFESIEWETDGYVEKFTAKVVNVYPELFDKENETGVELGNVVYSNGIPSFLLTINDRCSNSGELNNSVSQNALALLPEKSTFSRGMIRSMFSAYQIFIDEEKIKQPQFYFFCKSNLEIDNENFLEAINNLAKKTNCGIVKLSIKPVRNSDCNDGFSGNICFDPKIRYEDGLNLQPLAWRLNLLLDKNKAPGVMTQVYRGKTLIDSIYESKVGEIVRNDGSRTEFYKNSQGKILKKDY